jgi:tRNA A-37 threonylcarbamoyl transferase component Bud32
MPDADKVGRYRLLQLIATGGMGEVFLARSEGPAGFSKTVVIKRILRHLAAEEQFVEMFLNEARVAADLAHPNIVQIFELGEDAGAYFIAMEYIHGRSLRAVKQKLLEKRQLFSPVLAARLCSQALQGLHYAHTLTDAAGQPLNVVHRDISPDNLLVGFNGQVKVVDFGIAKAANAITTTRTGTVKGKYAYMAPEQLTGGAIDGRTDVYATGVLLYELLTGARPYTAATEPALIHVILSTRPAPPRERNPALPEAVNELILHALEKDPRDRFASAEEMSLALEDIVAGSGHSLTPAQVGAFLKDLFGAEAAALPAVSPAPGRISRVETRPSDAPAPGSAVALEVPATMLPTEVLPTPVSTGTRQKISALATGELPPGAQVSGVTSEGSLRPTLAARAGPGGGGERRKKAVPAALAAVALCAVGAAFVVGRGSAAPSMDPPPPPVVPVASAAPVPAPEPEPGPTAEPAPQPVAERVPEPVVAPAQEPPAPAARPVRRPAREVARARPLADAPGKVALRVSPWAEVFHDGKSLGITPMAPVAVPAGKQTFTLRNKDLNVTRMVTVTVPAGGEVVLRADLFD